MKRIAIVFVFVFAALVSFSQEPKKVAKQTTDPPKKEIKTVPTSSPKQAQIKKAQLKNAQMQNKKKKQVVRKTRAIRKKRNI